jgi:TonB family protein
VVALFVYPGLLTHHATKNAVTTQDTSALALRVQHNGGEILLTWNRDSDVVRNATHAVLSISDGDRHDNADLDLNTLHSGSVNYTPVTSDVVFRIEVTGKGQSKTTSESIRALQMRPSPMPPVGETGAQAQSGEVKPAGAVVPPVVSTAAAEPNAEEAAPKTPDRPVRTFRAEPLAQRLHPVTTEALPDAPSMGGSQASRPSVISGLNLSTAVPAPPPSPTGSVSPASASSAPPAPTGAARPAAGGNIVQAEPIRRKDPEFPKIARDAGARGAVELEAVIGTDGHVKSVKVLSGHAMLRKAASDAVMQWLYKPTLLNGVAVEAPVRVTINFQGR